MPDHSTTEDERILELIFDNSDLPIGRKIQRTETFGELRYDWLDFVELCMDLNIEFEEWVHGENFGDVRVEEFIKVARGKKVAVVVSCSADVMLSGTVNH